MLFEKKNKEYRIYNINSPGNFYDVFFNGLVKRIYEKNLQKNISFLKKTKILTIDHETSNLLKKKLDKDKNIKNLDVFPIMNLSNLLDQKSKEKLLKKKKILE